MGDGILFIDIEWNKYYSGKYKADGIIEIGAVSNSNLADGLFYYLKPENYIPKKVLQFLNVSIALLENDSVTKEKALSELEGKIHTYEQIMVWSEETMNILKDICDDEVLEGRKIGVLQDILAEKLGERMSYERTLKTYEIEYDPISLHNSKYDAECMMQLYERVMTDIDIETAESINKIHRLKGKALNQEKMGKLLDYYKCSYDLSVGHVTIRTQCSQWSIYLEDGLVKSLYHENYRTNRGKHSHQLPYCDFYTVLKYVLGHDASGMIEDRADSFERNLRITESKKRRQKERRRVAEKPIKQNGKYCDYYAPDDL